MSAFFKRIAKDIAVYGFADILLKAVSFLTLPIYTRVFAPEEYGLWSLVLAATGIFSAVLGLGGDSAYSRYYFEAKTDDERRELTSTWLLFLAGWSAAVTLLCVLGSGMLSRWILDNPEHGWLITLALLAVPVGLINSICGQVLRNQFRASSFAALNVVTTLLTIGLGLGAVLWLRMGIAGLLAGALAALVVMLPVRLYTIRDMLRPAFSGARLRNLLAYGVPLVPTSLAYWVFASSDRLMLAKLATMDQVGLYAVANSATSVLAFANSALGQAWSPHAVMAYEQEPERAPHLYGQVMTWLLAVFGLLTVGITAFAPEMLRLLTTPPFFAAASAVGPLALGYMAYASTQITASGISLTKRTGFFALYAWIAALLNIALNLWSIPRWGMIGAAWSTTAAYLFLTVAYLATSQRLWAVVYELRKVAAVVALTCAFTFGAALLPVLGLVAGVALKVAYCAVFAALLAVCAVGPNELRGLRGRLGRPAPAP